MDPTSTQRTWESARRLTRPAGSAIDGVGIFALLTNGPGADRRRPRILLQKQYRPPIDAVAVEVPAGLVDAGESAEECALRELREETGYVGELMHGKGGSASPVMFNGAFSGPANRRLSSLPERDCCVDPGFCNTNLRMVHVVVDLDRPENRDPRPQLEPDEFIECFAVPLADLWDECKRLEAEGYAIDARVGTLAEGVEVARQLLGVGAS